MKKLLLMIAALALAGAVAGAGETASTGKKVAMILKNFVNPFFISVREGGEAAAAELGMQLIVLAPLRADSNEEQVRMVDESIAAGVDLVIMCPSDTMGIISAMEKLDEAGIPVVNLNTRIGGDKRLARTFVAIENYDAGYETVTRLFELMGDKGEFMLIEGVPTAQTSIDRVKGALDALKGHPDVELVVRRAADYNRAKAKEVVGELLHAHPNVAGIYCCNDEMALGAVEAIAAAGGRPGSILVAGCDAIADARKAVKDGSMALTCDSQPFNQGYQSVMVANRVFAGEKLPPFIKLDMKVLGKGDLN